MLQGEPFRRGH